jgi:hypothetical protein
MFVRSFTHRRLFTGLPGYLAPPDDGGQGGDGGDDDGDDDKGSGDAQRTLTQAQIDRMIGRERTTAERAAARRLLEDLGVKDAGEAKRLLAEAKKAADKDRTETERAQTEAAEHKTAAEQARREAATAKLQLKIDRKLLAADADPARLERISKNVFVDLDDDADDAAIDAAIAAMKSETPEWFKAGGAGDDDKGTKRTGPAPSGAATGGHGPNGRAKPEDAMTRGRERARRLQGRDNDKQSA